MHEHEWAPAGPESRDGSTLMKCLKPGCDEIGFRLDVTSASEHGRVVR